MKLTCFVNVPTPPVAFLNNVCNYELLILFLTMNLLIKSVWYVFFCQSIVMCFFGIRMICFLAYTGNLFIEAYHRITYKGFKNRIKAPCPSDGTLSFIVWLWCAFYNKPLKKHIILLLKCTSPLADKRKHISMVSDNNVKSSCECNKVESFFLSLGRRCRFVFKLS